MLYPLSYEGGVPDRISGRPMVGRRGGPAEDVPGDPMARRRNGGVASATE